MNTQNPAVMRATRLLDALSSACIFLASICLVVLLLTFGWLVFGRYVLNVTPTWVEQLALVLVCYITFLGAASGIHHNTHLGVTMFRDMSPRPLRYSLHILSDVIIMALGAAMCWYSFELAQFGWDTLLPMLNVPESVRSFSSVICGGAMFLFAGARLILQFFEPGHGYDLLEQGQN